MSAGGQSIAGRLTPAQRAEADAARIRARRERQLQGSTPGPGAYDTRPSSADRGSARPSSAFRSRTQRSGDLKPREGGDPGAYNPYSQSSLQTRTFNRSSSVGAGFFGSSSKRSSFEKGADSPGPGAYDTRPVTPQGGKASAMFASQSKREGGISRSSSSPGVGTYSPRYADGPATMSSAFKSSEPRFKNITAAQDVNVGPGTYSQDFGTVSQALTRSAMQRSASAAFGSSSRRNVDIEDSGSPGPGAYDCPSTLARPDSRPSAAFQSASPRQAVVTHKDVGDPGAYNPYAESSLSAAGKTFNRSIAAGAGFFGSTSTRGIVSPPVQGKDSPGPCAYDTHPQRRVECKPSAAFLSQSPRGMPLPGSVSAPGAGTYSPKYDDAPRGGAAVFKSTEPRFKHDRERELMAEVGPGKYSQNTGTLCESVRNSSKNLSTAFASTTLRDL